MGSLRKYEMKGGQVCFYCAKKLNDPPYGVHWSGSVTPEEGIGSNVTIFLHVDCAYALCGHLTNDCLEERLTKPG